MDFINPTLLGIGLPIVAVPVVIHLINLMRHRRVPWAAMEFLLASKKKNNTWIRLKELLLLLMRMAAIAAVAFILAQPLLRSDLGKLFGTGKTHHVVLLDDSFSMSDRWANTSAFDEARHVIGRLADQAGKQTTQQTFTLLRYSRARTGGRGTQFDLLQESVNSDFPKQLEDALRGMTPSQMAIDVAPALDALARLLPDTTGEDVIVYLVSDFRARDWESPDNVAEALTQLTREATQLHLINCVDATRPNLGVTSLVALPGARAAGVPVTMEVTVHNFGSAPVENVQVSLSEDGRERPAVTIDALGAGRSESRRFEVFFPTAGTHEVTARLASDAVQADNARFALLDLRPAVPILIVDGDEKSSNALFLTTVFQPGGTARTGLDPVVERPSYLNNHALDKFATIYLADVERLDPPAVAALEKYVEAGGGLVFFVGPNVQTRFYNETLYRDGVGLFPVPLLRETQLLVSRLETSADVEASDEGIFRVFTGERNSYLASVAVDRYIAAPKGWTPPIDSGTKILARLRNGDPLVVERPLGRGRVVAVLTTAAPTWNNWGLNPSFVMALHEIQSHLATAGRGNDTRLVGAPIELALDAAAYQPRVRVISPDEGELGALAIDGTVSAEGVLSVPVTETGASGFYDVQLATVDNQAESRRFALNVESDEGDLAMIDRDQLAEKLPAVQYEFRQAADIQVAGSDTAGSNISDFLLYLLVGMLVGEQALAYSASYHPKAQEAKR